jgi:hypothetical protein
MHKINSEEKGHLVFVFSFFVSVIFSLISLTLIGVEAYVRWNLNKEFTFLGGNGLSALLIATAILLVGLSIAHRSNKNS